MLGWEIFVTRQSDDTTVARWRTGPGGLEWLNSLVAGHRAVNLGGDGYPNRYSIAARVLLPIVAGRLPRHSGPLAIGDDYVMPPGWSKTPAVNSDAVAACALDEQLLLEAWNLS